MDDEAVLRCKALPEDLRRELRCRFRACALAIETMFGNGRDGRFVYAFMPDIMRPMVSVTYSHQFPVTFSVMYSRLFSVQGVLGHFATVSWDGGFFCCRRQRDISLLDDWICVRGVWFLHGRNFSSMPF